MCVITNGSITGNLDIKEGTYALLGAASFLAGAMRMTVSMCVILLELTNNLELLPLVMVVLLAAKAVGDVTKVLPIYDLHIKLKNIPLLELAPERFLRKLWASDAMSQHTVSFTRVEKISNIIDILQSNHHNGFPVVEECDGETNFLGVRESRGSLQRRQDCIFLFRAILTFPLLLTDCS